MKKLLMIFLVLLFAVTLFGAVQGKSDELEHYTLVSVHLCDSGSDYHLAVFVKSANESQITHDADTYLRHKDSEVSAFTEWEALWENNTTPYTKTIEINKYYATEIMVETEIWDDGYSVAHQTETGTIWDGNCEEFVATPTVRPTSISTAVSTVIPEVTPQATKIPTVDDETNEPSNVVFMPVMMR